MGTGWAVWCDRPELLPEAERIVRDADSRLSRFAPASALSRLNTERVVDDSLLAAVVRTALDMRRATEGAFDPTVGAALVALGYDRGFDQLCEPVQPRVDIARPGVRVDGDRLWLDGPGRLDLGGVAKGWTVDRVHDWLRAEGGGHVLVDGGGDLRGSGRTWPIGVGPGWAVHLDGDAVATSSTRRRRWPLAGGGHAHHIVDSTTGQPARSTLVVATVRAPDAATADAFATALLVDPDRSLTRLESVGGRALVQGADGRWWTTDLWEDVA